MTGSNHATVWYGVEICLAPIPGSMKADGKPKITRAAQRQAEEESDEGCGQQAFPLLAVIAQMDQTKNTGQRDCRRPKTDATGQGKLGVAAKQEFFKEPHQQKHERPECSEAGDT